MNAYCYIGLLCNDGHVDAIYCHRNGHPSHQINILLSSYDTADKVRKLIELGDIDVLGSKVKPSEWTHSFSTPEKDTVVAFHRDKGDPWDDVKPEHYKDKDDFIMNTGSDYVYMFNEATGEWIVWSQETNSESIATGA